jgi:two-component system, chemotaxis family, protein-glutamate methylesterase/glutaminase
MSEYQLETPFSFACPECGGVLRPAPVAGLRRFRCHIGHVMTAEVLALEQIKIIESKLGGALAGLNEHATLCGMLAQDAADNGNDPALFEAAATQSREQTKAVRDILEQDWIYPSKTTDSS